jgi:Zinc knuckle
VARLAILLVTAQRLAAVADISREVLVATRDTVAVMAVDSAVRHATRVVAMVTFLVSVQYLGGPLVSSGADKVIGDCTQGQKCYNCGLQGHLSRDCPSETSSERTCYSCHKPGHVQAQCPER